MEMGTSFFQPRRADQTLFLLAMIELGIRLKKPVFLVNSMISDCPSDGKKQHNAGGGEAIVCAMPGRVIARP